MAGFRATGFGINGIGSGSALQPGDVLLLGESLSAGANAVVGASTLTAAMIATGIINRSGSTAGYTDTTDTAANIILALQGNNPFVEVLAGTSFRLRVINTVAFLLTLAAGVGVTLGGGTLNVAASTWRDYIITVTNGNPPVTINSNTATSTAVIFVLNPGQSALKIGSDSTAFNIQPGMLVTGSGVPANTTVQSVTYGQGGIVGVVLSAATTTTVANTPLAFSPTVRIDSIGSGTL